VGWIDLHVRVFLDFAKEGKKRGREGEGKGKGML